MNSLPGVAPSVPAEVADSELFWVDGGLLHGWAVTHSRMGHPLGTGDQQVRFMFTQSNHTAVPLMQQWVEHLGSLGVNADRASSRVFWRLAVRQRSLGLTAQPCGNVADAIESARQVSNRAATLTVSFGFAPSETIPKWVVRDNDVPVFVGLPHHHLVRVTDPRASLAALVAGAHVRTKVHEIM